MVELNSEDALAALERVKQMSMTGWLRLPAADRVEELEKILATAGKIRRESEALVCIGIGGSYLGHKALIEAIAPKNDDAVEVLFAGNSLDPAELDATLRKLGDRDFSVNIISKSGGTTEILVAWRILRARLREKYGESWRERVYVTTDAESGQLRAEAERNGYTAFDLPADVGGRYSVLTVVGLLPLACAGADIAELLAGAGQEFVALSAQENESSVAQDNAGLVKFADGTGTGYGDLAGLLKYALTRQNAYRAGADTEIFASFHAQLQSFGAWWQQLFGESEGKNGQGIFPAVATYTTDLHSLGQFLQQGRRNLLETILTVENCGDDIAVPARDAEAADNADWLDGRTLAELNRVAEQATITAHRAGGITVNTLTIPDFSTRSFGALAYFLELTCAVSATLQGVNPFDQPGVEAYKEEMRRILNRDAGQNYVGVDKNSQIIRKFSAERPRLKLE